ncbi:hypothetical protein CS063_07325 [Sporanaerobium hydrogeniformans]|uniref:Uncharacterized protein n=1 Tax=Sporanaerobium hydrogeniformans TaxID=3072179 RepID=A0AC61DF05_9FIRM|nr:HlyD family efflux transporter periplasmic adaptor subunit [Sporanaerobium hydrogeniformans]PHV71132.1 hypothetical protein CS063_07325 [Sporanaerobium hydrogeniformans]
MNTNKNKKKASQKNYFNPYDPQPNFVRQSTSLKRKKTSNTKRVSFNKNSQRNRQVEYGKPVPLYKEYTPQERQRELQRNNKISPKQLKKNKKRRQRRFLLKVSILMLLTIGLAWGGITLKEQLTYPKVTYLKVQKGYLDDSESFDGLIVRNEKVYYSEGAGSIGYIAGEGEKISKKGKVCVLLDEAAVQATMNEKEAVSSTLYNEAEKRKELSYYQDEDYQLVLEVKNVFQDFYSQNNKENTDAVYTLRKALDTLTEKRTDLYIKDQKQVNNTLTTQLSAIDRELASGQQVSYAEQAGIVSYKIDGKEELLTKDQLEELDYATYKSLKENSKYDILSSSMVEPGKPLYKLVLEDSWYIVSYMNSDKAERFQEGESYILTFDTAGQEELKMKVIKKREDDKRTQLIFETQEQGNKFLGLRTVNYSVGNKRVEGLKIPVQAIVEQHMLKIPATYLVEREGEQGCYRKKNEITEFVKVDSHSLVGDSVYILQELGKSDALQLEDVLVLPESGESTVLKEVEPISGVYVINGKLAQFKVIEMVLQNEEYALVKPGGNTELKELDKIISNPKSISKDQLLDHMNIQNE